MKKEALRIRKIETAGVAGLHTLRSGPVEWGQIWCVQRIAFETDTVTALGNTRARIFIEGHGYKHYLGEQDAPVAGRLYWMPEPVWLIPREQLCIEFDQAQAGAIMEMFLTGYWSDFKEGIG